MGRNDYGQLGREMQSDDMMMNNISNDDVNN
jgi:hypothetical protein